MKWVDDKYRFSRFMKQKGLNFSFVPETYTLIDPVEDRQERAAFLKRLENGGLDEAWFLKGKEFNGQAVGVNYLPPRSSALESLRIDLVAQSKHSNSTINDSQYVVQKGLSNLLTYKGHFFNIRALFLVPSIEPLLVYDCHHGLAHVSKGYGRKR